MLCHQDLVFYIFLSFFPRHTGQYPADKSPGLPDSISHPVSLRQRQQRLSRPGTITPHFPVSPARRTSSRYKWTTNIYRYLTHANKNCNKQGPDSPWLAAKWKLGFHNPCSDLLFHPFSQRTSKPCQVALAPSHLLHLTSAGSHDRQYATRSNLLDPHMALPHPCPLTDIYTHTFTDK